MIRKVPWYALVIATFAGFGAWAIRSATEQGHPIYVGLGAFGIVGAICIGLTAIDRS